LHILRSGVKLHSSVTHVGLTTEDEYDVHGGRDEQGRDALPDLPDEAVMWREVELGRELRSDEEDGPADDMSSMPSHSSHTRTHTRTRTGK
jgi:hypothetical protein